MSTVSSTSATTASTSTTSSSTILVSGDEFLTILVAQLGHQDPLNPTDPTQFVTELAQLTQVQNLTDIKSSLDSLTSATQQGITGQWASTIGDYMQVDDTALSSGDQVTITPSSDYDSVTLSLKASDGTTTTKTFSSSDSLVFSSDGSYTVTGAEATKDGQTVKCSTKVYRYIAGVQSSDSGTKLVATDGTTYSASDIKLITQ